MADRRSRPPAPPWIGRLLTPVYLREVRRRNRRFDSGRDVHDVGTPVISVGNLSVGGVGKTPMVMHLIEHLRAAGRNPGVAMRGYKSAPGGLSDEQAEYYDRFENITVIAHPNRVKSIKRAREQGFEFDCLILDDGFQHRYVMRDFDILLLDASRDPFEDHCLPRGWLREPAESIARADAVVLTHAELVSPDELERQRNRIAHRFSPQVLGGCRHTWSRFEGPEGPIEVDTMRGARALALCGVGHPDAFLAHALSAGLEIEAAVVGADHMRIDTRLLRKTIAQAKERGCEAVVTTAKDWVKIAPALESLSTDDLAESPPFLVAIVGVTFDFGGEALNRAALEAVGGRAC